MAGQIFLSYLVISGMIGLIAFSFHGMKWLNKILT